MILPIGILIALLWLLFWLTSSAFERSYQAEGMFALAILGGVVIVIATFVIHFSWPHAVMLLEKP